MTRERAAELLSEVMVLDDPEMAEAHRVAISAIRQQEHFRDVTKKVEPLTNAQKIRAMSDEELAEFLIDLADDGNLRIRDWLQQPAEENDHDERKENENV